MEVLGNIHPRSLGLLVWDFSRSHARDALPMQQVADSSYSPRCVVIDVAAMTMPARKGMVIDAG